MRKVRMTEEEQQRILASQSKGVFDPVRVRVLVPTVGGPNATGAIVLGAGLAKRSAHPVEALSIKEPVLWSERVLRFLNSRRTKNGGDRPSAIHRALLDAGQIPNIREVNRKDVAAAIVEEARKGIDFVVMGASSHGRWLGGPVLEEVVRRSPCHVAIVKVKGEEPIYKRILVPFDGGVFSRVAVEFAVRYAEVTEAELTLAIVSERKLSEVSGTDVVGTGEGVGLNDAALERISPLLRTVTRRPKVLELGNDLLLSGMAREAASGQYDLVIIGAENRAVQHRLFFGADNERLIREAPVTVAIVVPNVAQLR